MADENGLDELRDRLKEHSHCFNSLLELVPPKYYFTDNEEEQGRKFFKNKKNKAPKQLIKESSKKAKLARLDPTKHKSIIELQTTNESKETKDKTCISVEDVECSNIGDLRTKLHVRIELLQRKRKATTNGSERPSKKSKKKVKNEKNEKNINKQVKDGKSNSKDIAGSKKVITNSNGKVVFSKFDFTADVSKPTKKGKNQNKNYKKILEKAENKKKELEEMKATDAKKAHDIIKQEAWRKALGKSEGIKQKDDPTLVKKAMKRKEKLKSKHKKEWKERTDNQKKQVKEKQDRREKNIRERTENKKKKKVKKGGRTPGF